MASTLQCKMDKTKNIFQKPSQKQNHWKFLFTCTLASLRLNCIAKSSRANTSGYWVFSKANSSWCSWYVVKVVRLRRTFLDVLSPGWAVVSSGLSSPSTSMSSSSSSMILDLLGDGYPEEAMLPGDEGGGDDAVEEVSTCRG